MIGIILLTAALTVDLDAVRMIESSGNPQAYNESSGARGLYQITKICLDDWNGMHPREQYSLDDLWDPKINKRIAVWYLFDRIPQLLDHYGVLITTENILISYHDGIGNLRKYLKGKRVLGKEMIGYVEKYNKLINNI